MSVVMKASGYRVGDVGLLVNRNEKTSEKHLWTLVSVRKGVGMYLLDNRLVSLNENDLLLFPPYVSYSFMSADLGDEYNESVDAVVLRFDEAWLGSLLRTFPNMGDTVLRLMEMKIPIAITGRKWLATYALMNDLWESTPENEPVLILDILNRISTSAETAPILSVNICIQTQSDLPERIERIERYISCNLLSGISLDDISSYVGMNRTYFCQFFRKHFGVGLIDYVNTRRLDMACSLLTGSGYPVSEIAQQCGFKTVTYFNRVFKSAKGLSPNEYRIRNR